MKLNENMHMPAYPLFVKDPYFSIWSKTDKLNESNTIFWHGEEKPIFGYIQVDGKQYCFMGLDEKVDKLTQVAMEITALSTIYHFKGDDFTLEIEFLSPLTLSNLSLLSCPVCYLNYHFQSSRKHDIMVQIKMSQEICYNTSFENVSRPCRANRFTLSTFECVTISLERPLLLSQSNDEDGADWGNYYLAGDTCRVLNENHAYFLVSQNKHEQITNQRGTFLIAYDDHLSIFYYGEYLKGYYFSKNNRSIFDALEDAYQNQKQYEEICRQENQKIEELSKEYNEKMLFVLLSSYRQSIGAHKLVENKDKELLFLSKECNSDGCIATVDITYPSMPLYLLLQPELVKGMLLPIFKFARFPIWEYEYAPHDAGIYPYCLGQYYAILSNEEEQLDLHVHDWHQATVLPFYYQFPKGTKIYDETRQMPIEESGNMLIITYLYTKISKDLSLAKSEYDLLEKWTNYLVKKGLKPENQLCTDDFAGHLDGNANLAIKAVIGINAFAEINRLLNNQEKYIKYHNLAKEYAVEWEEIYFRKDHSTLSFYQEDTYSLKYNMAIDSLFDGCVFNDDLKEKEINYYLTKKNRYGIPLDTRNTYSKTDWLGWVCCLTKDKQKRLEVFECIYNFLCETTDRVPFSDWIETTEPKYYNFRNRAVQGGLFLPLLFDNWRKLCQK